MEKLSPSIATMKFNAVAAAVSAAVLTGVAHADEAENPVAPDLPTFTVSLPEKFLPAAEHPCHHGDVGVRAAHCVMDLAN